MPWCKYFIPKIAAAGISPDDPALNEHIVYAKCVRGHVLRDANDWIQCENLPAPDATCWQEGGDTIFTLRIRKKTEAAAQSASQALPRPGGKSQPSRS